MLLRSLAGLRVFEQGAGITEESFLCFQEKHGRQGALGYAGFGGAGEGGGFAGLLGLLGAGFWVWGLGWAYPE